MAYLNDSSSDILTCSNLKDGKEISKINGGFKYYTFELVNETGTYFSDMLRRKQKICVLKIPIQSFNDTTIFEVFVYFYITFYIYIYIYVLFLSGSPYLQSSKSQFVY